MSMEKDFDELTKGGEMMCYRDRTWCSAKGCEDFMKCDRALTEQVLQDAKDWWGGDGAPIYLFVDKQECYKEEK